MVPEEKDEFNFLNRKLNQISEEKIINAQKLSNHEHLEQYIHKIASQERKIIRRLFESWEGDRTFTLQLEQVKIELDQNRRRIEEGLEHKKNDLFSKKRELYHLENQLVERKHKYRREGM